MKRDRAILLGALVVVSGIAWAHMVQMASETTLADGCHAALTALAARPWSGRELVDASLMWAVMMLAMMLPIVSPWVLALPRAARERRPGAGSSLPAVAFLLGYGATWLVYSILAAVGQLGLQRVALLSEGGLMSPLLAGGLLAVAGVYQLSPYRDACMTHCRSPMGFFLTRWREGSWGAFTMGARHGIYCLGCCWAVMALSFVFGVMNLLWMALATAFLLVEKITAGRWMSKTSGVALVAGAAWMIVRAR